MQWTDLQVASSDRLLDRLAASRDLWPGGTLDFWQGRDGPLPARVLWPESPDEALAAVRFASEAGLPVVPWGAGSGVCGGAVGVEGAVVVDCKRLDHIGQIDEQAWVLEVGAGVIGEHLEHHLEALGWTLGHSPSSLACSTVGGWAAARSAGQLSSRYGVFEDMVVAVEVATPGRGLLRVGLGGDAPDEWLDLLLGSEGTLGVITRVWVRVWPLPERRWLRGYRVADVQTALDAMRGLMQGELWPAVVRLYDPVDTRIGGRTKPKREHGAPPWWREWLASVADLPAVRRRSLALPLALPGLLNRVLDGMASGCLLVVGFEGRAAVVAALVEAARPILDRHGDDLGPGPGERWYASRHAVSYKLAPIFERGGFADTMEVAARWSALPRVYADVRAALGRSCVVMAHMSHVYPEGGSIYFSFAGRGDADVYRATWQRALAACLASGATVTHHHGVGRLKAEAASREVGPAVAGWRALKATLDPRGVLNPGAVFVDVAAEVPPPASLAPADGLAEAPVQANLHSRAAAAGGGEIRWPWERLPAPPRWQRLPWHTGWIGVSGTIDGAACSLGRGPRSAAGPDLRAWLAHHDPSARASFAVVPDGPRWLGEARVARPWEVARELLRADLRPATLVVVDGALRVGFRGPAAEALGGLASALVPGGLTPVPWQRTPLPSGPLVACDIDDPRAVAVTLLGALRRAE